MLRNLWVGCLLVVLLATACGGGKSVFSLEVGDCFDESPSQEAAELTFGGRRSPMLGEP